MLYVLGLAQQIVMNRKKKLWMGGMFLNLKYITSEINVYLIYILKSKFIYRISIFRHYSEILINSMVS